MKISVKSILTNQNPNPNGKYKLITLTVTTPVDDIANENILSILWQDIYEIFSQIDNCEIVKGFINFLDDNRIIINNKRCSFGDLGDTENAPFNNLLFKIVQFNLSRIKAYFEDKIENFSYSYDINRQRYFDFCVICDKSYEVYFHESTIHIQFTFDPDPNEDFNNIICCFLFIKTTTELYNNAKFTNKFNKWDKPFGKPNIFGHIPIDNKFKDLSTSEKIEEIYGFLAKSFQNLFDEIVKLKKIENAQQ